MAPRVLPRPSSAQAPTALVHADRAKTPVISSATFNTHVPLVVIVSISLLLGSSPYDLPSHLDVYF